MSAPHAILDNLPSFCQKLSDLVEVRRTYNKNNFAGFFLRHGVDSFACGRAIKMREQTENCKTKHTAVSNHIGLHYDNNML